MVNIELSDRRILVTGSSTGIGAAVASACAQAGAAVTVHFNSSGAEAHVLVDTIRAQGGRAPLGEIDDTLYGTVMNLNVRSVVAASQAAVRHMRKSGRGSIINTSLIAARNATRNMAKNSRSTTSGSTASHPGSSARRFTSAIRHRSCSKRCARPSRWRASAIRPTASARISSLPPTL